MNLRRLQNLGGFKGGIEEFKVVVQKEFDYLYKNLSVQPASDDDSGGTTTIIQTVSDPRATNWDAAYAHSLITSGNPHQVALNEVLNPYSGRSFDIAHELSFDLLSGGSFQIKSGGGYAELMLVNDGVTASDFDQISFIHGLTTYAKIYTVEGHLNLETTYGDVYVRTNGGLLARFTNGGQISINVAPVADTKFTVGLDTSYSGLGNLWGSQFYLTRTAQHLGNFDNNVFMDYNVAYTGGTHGADSYNLWVDTNVNVGGSPTDTHAYKNIYSSITTAGTVNSVRAVEIAMNIGGTVATAYGLYIGPISGATSNYAVYMKGTSTGYAFLVPHNTAPKLGINITAAQMAVDDLAWVGLDLIGHFRVRNASNGIGVSANANIDTPNQWMVGWGFNLHATADGSGNYQIPSDGANISRGGGVFYHAYQSTATLRGTIRFFQVPNSGSVTRNVTYANLQQYETLRIYEGGTVFVGPVHADTPVISAASLQVYASGGAYIIARNATADIEAAIGSDTLATFVGAMTAHSLQLRTSNTTYVTIASTGNVGINTTPQTMSQVYVTHTPSSTEYYGINVDHTIASGEDNYNTAGIAVTSYRRSGSTAGYESHAIHALYKSDPQDKHKAVSFGDGAVRAFAVAENSAGYVTQQIFGVVAHARHWGSNGITNVLGAVKAIVDQAGTSDVNYGIGLWVEQMGQYNTGTFRDKYGIKIENITGGTSVNYAIQTNLGKNYFVDATGVGGDPHSYPTLKFVALVSDSADQGVNGKEIIRGWAYLTGAQSGPIYGARGVIELLHTSGTSPTAIAVQGSLTVYGIGGTLSYGYGVSGVVSAVNGTITAARSFVASAYTYNSAAIGTYVGMQIENPNKGGSSTITNAYGLYIDNINAGGTINYALYSDGGNVYFGGNVGIGVAPPTKRLHVRKAHTENYTDHTVFVDSTFNPSSAPPAFTRYVQIQTEGGVLGSYLNSDVYFQSVRVAPYVIVTSTAPASMQGIAVDPYVATGAVELNELIGVNFSLGHYGTGNIVAVKHINIANLTVLNGGTVGAQYGIYIGSITGATNNYAIYSAGGQVYFAGDVGIGVAPDLSYKLKISGNVLFGGLVYIPSGQGIRNDGNFYIDTSTSDNGAGWWRYGSGLGIALNIDYTGRIGVGGVADAIYYFKVWNSAVFVSTATFLASLYVNGNIVSYQSTYLTDEDAAAWHFISSGESANYFYAGVIFQHDGVSRWAVYKGGDATADFQIARYNDAGVYQNTAFRIERSTGTIVTETHLNVGGSLSVATTATIGATGYAGEPMLVLNRAAGAYTNYIMFQRAGVTKNQLFTDSNEDFRIRTNADATPKDAIWIDYSTGSVGIGGEPTSSYVLYVTGNSRFIKSGTTTVEIGGAGGSDRGQLILYGNDTSFGYQGILEPASGTLTASRTWSLPNVSGTIITTGNLTDITSLGTISGTGLIVTGGVTLLGTSSALTGVFGAGQLEVAKSSNGTLLLSRTSADTGGSTIEFLKRRSAWGVVSNGDRVGTIGWSAADSVDAANGAQIWAEVSAAPGSNDMPMDIVFATTPDGTQTVVEALRIKQTGNVKFAARIDSYNGLATEGWGVPAIMDCVGPTEVSAAVTATDMTNTDATGGFYRISTQFDVTGTGTSATYKFNIKFMDALGNTDTVELMSILTNAPTPHRASAVYFFVQNDQNPAQFEITKTGGNSSDKVTYAFVVERLN